VNRPNRFTASVAMSGSRRMMVYVCGDGLVEILMTGRFMGPRRLVLDLSETKRLVETLLGAVPHAEDA
jgi:hypothetical protein